MLDLFRTAHRLQTIFQKRRWKYCFIGGVAVQKWGQARFTKDVDLTILTGFGNEATFIDVLLGQFEARIPNAKEFALHRRTLLLQSSAGIGIDVSLGALDIEQSAVNRAKNVLVVDSIRLKLCTAEDLIVFKAFANRGIDWLDIEGVIVKQGKAKLDWAYVFGQLEPLVILKEEPEIVSKLRKLIDDISDD